MVRITRNWIALVLAIGLCTALNLVTAAILYDAIADPRDAGISENATQILTGWGGGVVGILGAVFGYEAGSAGEKREIRHRDPGPLDDSE